MAQQVGQLWCFSLCYPYKDNKWLPCWTDWIVQSYVSTANLVEAIQGIKNQNTAAKMY